MKNTILLLALSVIASLVFSSCYKEELVEESYADSPTQKEIYETDDSRNDGTADTRNTVIQITVDKVTEVQTTVTLSMQLTTSYDLTRATLEPTQTVDFTDANGNTTTLTFSVDSYTGGNGTLDVIFDKGGQDLTGLDINTSQDFVIEEDFIN